MRRFLLLASAIAAGASLACAVGEESAPSSSRGATQAALPVSTPRTEGVSQAPSVRIYVAGVAEDTTLAPRIDRLELQIGAGTDTSATARWLRLDALDRNRSVFGYEILVDDLAFLHDPTLQPIVRRYILIPAHGPSREYVRARGGAALTPNAVLDDWLPRVPPSAPDQLSFLGRSFQLASVGAPATWEPGRSVVARVDSDMLVATGRDFRDDGRGRRGPDYRWQPLAAGDYLAMIDAGFNLFYLEPGSLRQGVPLPAFFVATEGWRDLPELPLCANFLGAVMFSDEPALHVMQVLRTRDALTPEAVASAIVAGTRGTHQGPGKYSTRYIAARLDHDDVHYGNVRQPPFPVWEGIASAAWYELESGASGWCFEARLDPSSFARRVERALGVRFPEDPAQCIRLHCAIARGAARRFNAPWGVSVYGQMEETAAARLFPLAYDAGATYFWMWTSDGDHHVPHARQLHLARALRDHAKAEPRGGLDSLLSRANVALVLPWGYALDEYSFGTDGSTPCLWGLPTLPLHAKNPAGARHGDILSAAMREAVDLLASNTLFDVLFLREEEGADGYAEIRRVRENGDVERTAP